MDEKNYCTDSGILYNSLPKIVPVFFDVSVFLTWTEFSRGFLFLIEQKEMLVDRQFAGVVITPMDTHLMASIIGLYFGGSLVKK